jgi:hypothetical protein
LWYISVSWMHLAKESIIDIFRAEVQVYRLPTSFPHDADAKRQPRFFSKDLFSGDIRRNPIFPNYDRWSAFLYHHPFSIDKGKNTQMNPIRPKKTFCAMQLQKKKTHILYMYSLLVIQVHLFAEMKATPCHVNSVRGSVKDWCPY